eukprot:3083374-Rhodomonas_salina.2
MVSAIDSNAKDHLTIAVNGSLPPDAVLLDASSSATSAMTSRSVMWIGGVELWGVGLVARCRQDAVETVRGMREGTCGDACTVERRVLAQREPLVCRGVCICCHAVLRMLTRMGVGAESSSSRPSTTTADTTRSTASPPR